MRYMSLLIVLFISIIMFSVSSFAKDEENKALDIVSVVCDQNASRFNLKYIQSNDDFFSQPILPKNCKLSNSKYKVTGGRGPFSENRCGAEPPISIKLSRNGIEIISDTVFGGNCFGGPSIAEIEITELKGRISSIKLCIFKEGESPVAEDDNFEPACIVFQDNAKIKKVLPISQSKLNGFISE